MYRLGVLFPGDFNNKQKRSNIMKKTISLFLAVYLLLCFSAVSYAESGRGFGGLLSNIENNFEPAEEAKDTFGEIDAGAVLDEASHGKAMTIMIYMCGSNLESAPQASASGDVKEIAASGFSAEDLNILILPGGAKKWHIDCFDESYTGIYAIRPDGVAKCWETDRLLNMGDPATLSTLLKYGYENFPADKYGLIIWNHGGGSIGGVCSDETTGDNLSIPELQTALKDGPFCSQKLEWIGFDACLMASTEVAVMISPYAKYLVASEETEPGYGWDYSFLKNVGKNDSGAEIGQKIIDSYFDWYEKNCDIDKLTMSCIDLDGIKLLTEKIDGFFSEAADSLNQKTYNDFSKAIRNVSAFGVVEGRNGTSFDLLDAEGLVRYLDEYVPTDGKTVLTTLSDTVVKARTSEDEEIGGLTLYHPLLAKDRYSSNLSVYKTFGIMPGYLKYIEQFGDMMVATPAASFSGLLATFSDTGKVQRALVSLPLTQQQADSLTDAELIVLQQSASVADAYHMVSVSEDVVLDDKGNLNGEFIYRNLFITDETGNPAEGSAPLYYTLNSDGQYQIPVVLHIREAGSSDLTEVDAFLICDESEDHILNVSSILAYDEVAGSYLPRFRIDPSLIQEICFATPDRTPVRDEDGAILGFNDWVTVGNSDFVWNVSEDYQMRFLENVLDPETLFVAFHVTDTRSNDYISELIHLTGSVDEGVFQVSYDDKDHLVTIQNPSCEYLADSGMLLVAMDITNVSEEEITVTMTELSINGVRAEEETTVYGTGPYYGLIPGETQTLFSMIPCEEETGAIETILFHLTVNNAETEEALGTIPVSGTTNLSAPG